MLPENMFGATYVTEAWAASKSSFASAVVARAPGALANTLPTTFSPWRRSSGSACFHSESPSLR